MGEGRGSEMSVELQLALEERKLVQGVIDRQEEMSFKIRGWAIALFAGLTFTFFRQSEGEFSDLEYVLVVSTLSLLFYYIEKRHMKAFFKLVTRASKIEEILVANEYKFKLQESLRGKKRDDDFSKVGSERFNEIKIVYFALPIIGVVTSGAYQTIIKSLIGCD